MRGFAGIVSMLDRARSGLGARDPWKSLERDTRDLFSSRVAVYHFPPFTKTIFQERAVVGQVAR
jgi:hypothetical protein